MRLPNRFLNTTSTVPSEIEWEFGRNEVELPRNISWAGSGEFTIWTENPQIHEYLDGETISFLWDEVVKFVPDVWEPEEHRVWVYLGDHLVGRLENRAKEIEFFEHLATYDHKIGISPESYVFEDEGKVGVDVRCDIRQVLRIDWDEVRATIN